MPMLEDDEWTVVHAAFRAGDGAAAILDQAGQDRGLPPVSPLGAGADLRERQFWPLVAGYRLFTGFEESEPNAVWHHVASLYGPPCRSCGKPLRTPVAKLCAACGAAVEPVAAPA